MQFDAAAPQAGNVLQAYGPEGFKISGVTYASNVLMNTTQVIETDLQDVGEITLEHLHPLLKALPRIEVLIIGSGATLVQLDPALRQQLRAHGLSVDVMDTGAACRTVAILLSESRRVGALLLRP